MLCGFTTRREKRLKNVAIRLGVKEPDAKEALELCPVVKNVGIPRNESRAATFEGGVHMQRVSSVLWS
jgi:hypothetical protein